MDGTEMTGAIGTLAAELTIVAVAAMFALTGGDWVALITLLIGTSGLGSLFTSWFNLRKIRLEEAEAGKRHTTEARTVARDEAESAMKIMGEVVKQKERQYQDLAQRVEICEDRCRACQAEVSAHAAICPLYGGTPK
jgi:hypothetical protein